MRVSAKGYNGTVTFDGTSVTISRTGFIAISTKGHSDKRIPLSRISAVQWKPATRLNNGYISFSLSGGSEKQSKLGRNIQRAMDDVFPANAGMILWRTSH